MRLVYEQYARDKYSSPLPLEGKGSVKAIHYIMSFADSENVTPELAHKIAKAFVRKNFGEDAQAVIATHVDRSHVHCHVILNSYSLSGQKYYACRNSRRQARENVNGVCRAFGVTPALNFENKGQSINYFEWEQQKNGTSWKEQIRKAIDELIGSVNSLDELLQLLEERGYEIKRGKYISIRAPGQERFVRTKTLGEEYTEESLITRILYRKVGTGTTPTQDSKSQLRTAYIAVIEDVRILAVQNKKVPRKQIVTAAYSVDNDLDVYRLSAQLSVINKDKITSIGDLEGKISKLRAEYEKQRQEINNYIEEHNRMVSILEQAQEYFALSVKTELSDMEKMKLSVCKQAVQSGGILTQADMIRLRDRTDNLNKMIAARREKINDCRLTYDVYCDIRDTYKKDVSQEDYIERLVEEERQRQEQIKKNKKKSR
ncbi:Relaxase/Mobilisation nuclease domain-containing protein [Ruminococcus sp. YE71]|nr:Relaxase/Mobilisation nuclease domain-containing protein [Ruminococcus sp. YE78]SFW54162.1 Relaxase/Mobilisation nuclease domain-containing protein [Ruminococcus sp. YE71]